MKQKNHIFTWLDEVRKRPAMYVRDKSLSELEIMVYGYYAALNMHGVIENVPCMTRHFMGWLRQKTDWSLSCGWAYAINKHKKKDPWKYFFNCVDEYRKLNPETQYSVNLGKKHNPTGKKVTIGLNKLIEKPVSIDLVRYSPLSFYFLRFHYKNKTVKQDLIETLHSGFDVNVKTAMKWCLDEFCIEFDQWKK